jgi:NAD(P)-dependent dehydrogenase (short-subunit alcohol dehydrogenase family)
VDLRDRVAIITGARDDIGVATARRFLAEGTTLVLQGADAETIGALELEPGWLGRRVIAVGTAGDAEADIRATVDEALAAHGRIDILVNAVAGLDDGRSWSDTDRAEWERQAAAGPARAFDWCRAVIPPMTERRSGKIVNLAWSAGRYRSSYFPTGSSFRSGAAYAAGQGGILALTRELAFELGPDGIRVNAVVPGLIATREGQQDWERLPETARSYILLESAAGRLGTPDEVAAVICFLSSDRSSYVTGTSIDVNGGWWMS